VSNAVVLAFTNHSIFRRRYRPFPNPSILKKSLVAFLEIKFLFATYMLHFTLLQKKMQRPPLQQGCCNLKNKK
jgi:hypothetical protein